MLPRAFLNTPIAHRGLWGVGLPENSLGAIVAAATAGFGVEFDLQLSGDGEAMVFHDETLDRMCARPGWVCERTADQLRALHLAGTRETIPKLATVLRAIAGRVPLLIELKDQRLTPAGRLGPLEARVADLLQDYDGPVALMSFNPEMVENLARLAPNIPHGIVGCDWTQENPVPDNAADLNDYAAFAPSGSCFISHDWHRLDMPAVTRLRAQSVPILCWTVKSPQEEAAARRIAHNVTFEGYLPA